MPSFQFFPIGQYFLSEHTHTPLPILPCAGRLRAHMVFFDRHFCYFGDNWRYCYVPGHYGHIQLP